MSQNYGFTFDKQGNLKVVSAPFYANGKTVPKPKKTKTNGKIPAGVGFSASLNP